MTARALPLLTLTACAAASLPVDQLAPPGPGGATLDGPSAIISGETATLTVTASDLQAGDAVTFAWGTALGSGPCPQRQATGGSPCLEITGTLDVLGRAYAAEDPGAPGTYLASLDTSLSALQTTRYLQAFVSRGTQSATTNVVTVDVQQPYPALAPDVEELTARVEALESQLASVGSSVGVPEPVVFSCVPSAWEATVGSGSTTTVCSVDVTLPTRSIVYAQVDGHWHTSDTSHWCIAEINFPGEAPYPNGSSPYAQRWAPHHYLAGWTPINYSRARVLDAGTHTLSYTISAAPGGACYLNGSGLHGLTIGVSSTPSE